MGLRISEGDLDFPAVEEVGPQIHSAGLAAVTSSKPEDVPMTGRRSTVRAWMMDA